MTVIGGAGRQARRPQRTVRSTPTLLIYATSPGGTTLDAGNDGGNPFASALIEAARDPILRLKDLESTLRRLTLSNSEGHQTIECVGDHTLPGWRFAEDATAPRQRRTAQLLVVSDYSALAPNASLPGAAGDERRVAAMLAQHGFAVDQGVGCTRSDLLAALTSFRRRSRRSDVAVIYSTGHGVQLEDTVYLIPGDYPIGEGPSRAQLKRHAISVTRIANAAAARSLNLVFFAGCRTLALPNELTS